MAGVRNGRGADGDNAESGDSRGEDRCDLDLGVTCHVSYISLCGAVPRTPGQSLVHALANLEVLTSTPVPCEALVATGRLPFDFVGERELSVKSEAKVKCGAVSRKSIREVRDV